MTRQAADGTARGSSSLQPRKVRRSCHHSFLLGVLYRIPCPTRQSSAQSIWTWKVNVRRSSPTVYKANRKAHFEEEKKKLEIKIVKGIEVKVVNGRMY